MAEGLTVNHSTGEGVGQVYMKSLEPLGSLGKAAFFLLTSEGRGKGDGTSLIFFFIYGYIYYTIPTSISLLLQLKLLSSKEYPKKSSGQWKKATISQGLTNLFIHKSTSYKPNSNQQPVPRVGSHLHPGQLDSGVHYLTYKNIKMVICNSATK